MYYEGLPEWTKNNFTVLSAQFLKEAWIEKEIPAVILDIRSVDDAKKGFIKGAVSLPAADVEKSLARFPCQGTEAADHHHIAIKAAAMRSRLRRPSLPEGTRTQRS